MAHPALLILIVSGFATVLLNGWGWLYKANLLLHPLLGVGFTALMFYFAWRRFGRLGPAFPVRLWVGLPIAFSLLFAVPGVGAPSTARFYLLTAILLSVLAVGLMRLGKAVGLHEWFVAAWNYAGFGLWTLSVHSGLSIITLGQRGGITDIVLFHRTVNTLFTAFFVITIVLSLSGVFASSRAFADTQPRIWESVLGLFSRVREVRDGQPRAWSALMLTGVAAAALGGLVGLERVADTTAPSFEVPLSTIPIERRIPSERVTSFRDPRVAPAATDLSASCGSQAGCHEAIVQSFRGSNHAVSVMTPHIQKSFELMTAEVGAHNTKICAGCHTPGALFNEAADNSYFAKHENISCSFCHMVRDVWIGPAGSTRSSYTLKPPVGHLDLFMKDGAEKSPGWLDALLIRLSPVSHARQFSSPLLASDRFCNSCHEAQIPAERQAGLVKVRCIDCHMRPLEELGAKGTARSHFMPGANVTVPLLAGRAEEANLVTRWVAGEFPFSIAGWENRGWERLGGRPQATWLWMLFEPQGDPSPGRDFTLRILTANVGIGHRFPAAPFDLLDAWLEVRVKDAGGRVVFEQGFADKAGRIPADAHRLGGRVIGEDGKPIEHYRVWQPQHDEVARAIEPGRTTTDSYTFRIPDDAGGPLTVAAEWKYRKLNREFVDWAYGPDKTIPVVVVGSLASTIQLATGPGAAAPR